MGGGECVAQQGDREGDAGEVQAAGALGCGHQELVVLGEGRGRLKANLRFSPPAFLFKWMKMPASCSTQLGWLMSGTGKGSVSEYMLYNFSRDEVCRVVLLNRAGDDFESIILHKEKIQKKKTKITEFSVKVGGWGQQRTNFPLIFFFEEKHKLKTLEIA